MQERSLRYAALALLCVTAALLAPRAAGADQGGYAQAVLADHPSAFYEFGEAASATSFADSSGNGNIATSDGSDHTVPEGPFGTGQSLLIGDDGAQTPQLTAMQGDNSRTVELWFRTSESADQCVFSSGSQTANSSFSLCLTDGNQGGAPPPNTPGVYLQTWNADLYIPNLTLTDAAFHYIAATLSASTVSIDVDGHTPAGFVWNGSSYSSEVAQPFTLPSLPNTTATTTGIGSAGWAASFSGEIAFAAIYPAALSVGALNAHYQAATSAGAVPVNALPSIEQVVFVHGLNASCAVAGATDYKALYDAIVSQGRGIYTFCYDHDIAFGDANSGLSGQPNRCFSNTSRGESVPEAASVPRARTTSRDHIGPLYVSSNKFGVGESNDGDDPLAYDAAKLDDCLTALVNYDVRTYGHPLPIAVIGNSMGGAITRGWMQLAQSRNSPALEGVTTVMFIEGATQGSWIAAVGEGVDTGLLAGSPVEQALDAIARQVAASSFHANPGRAGIQDLAPQSGWYQSIVAAGTPPRLHYYALSVDITLDFKTQILWWNNDLGSTDFIGDGVIQLGSKSYNALPQWGGSQFLPFGAAADQHQYLIRPPTYVEQISIEPSGSFPFVNVSVNASNPYSNPYNHFNFGTYMGKEDAAGNFSGDLNVASCAPHAGTVSIPLEFNRVLENPANACGAGALAPALDAADDDGGRPLAEASSAHQSAVGRSSYEPVLFRDRIGRSVLALDMPRRAAPARLTLVIARHGTFTATLPRRLVARRVIRLDTTVSATPAGSVAQATVKLRLKGKLEPATHFARLRISSERPRWRAVLASPVPSRKAATAAGKRVIALVASANLVGLANLLSPSLRAGRSPAAVARALRAAHVHVKSIHATGAGKLTSLPDGDPGLLLPVTATAAGRPPLHTELVLDELDGTWRLVGSTT
ncbi:MAG: LamG-like jellyroll fold domain-containing protein [Solirubrobacteraceae bacterium]